MDLNSVHAWERTVVEILNLDGWDLDWCGEGFKSYDAKGLTPKNKKCVIEIKFRHKYYKTKMLEKAKYKKLILPKEEELNCPDTTLWTKQKKAKDVYLLEESQASYINNESGFNKQL